MEMSKGQAMLAASIEGKFASAQVPCRFDFSIFVPIAIQILTQLIQNMNCGKAPTAAELSARMANAQNDVLVRMAIREAVSKANKQRNMQMNGEEQSLVRNGLRDGFARMDGETRMAMATACCRLG